MQLPETVLAVTNGTTTTTSPSTPVLVVAFEVVIAVAVIGIAGTLFARLVSRIAVRAGASKAVASSIYQWMSVLVLIGAVGAATTLTGLSSQLTALTVSGIAGLAISLALQSTISNVISGVLLIQDGILRIGDDLQYGGPGGVRGEVVKISLRTTWLRNQDGVIVVIGNSNLSAGPIINYSAKARLQKKLAV